MTNVSLFQQSPPLALMTKTLMSQNLCTKFDSDVLYIHGYLTYNSPIQYTQGIYMSYMTFIYSVLPILPSNNLSDFLPFIAFLPYVSLFNNNYLSLLLHSPFIIFSPFYYILPLFDSNAKE